MFALQFQTLTVFSIEVAIRGKSNIEESYALGNGVSILQSIPSASADTVERYNVTLWVRDWENKTSFSNLNVTIFDLEGNGSSSYVSNGTGHVGSLLSQRWILRYFGSKRESNSRLKK
ncbi:hypothetical protein CW712_03775 [Candidatus Bathyarchaeota archaeon]|nr:MAG: hypothetical protein CW712_03775 [Candidatus Bathyarchaeota archaeon]